MIYVLYADGFEELEALAPVDVLRRAGFEVKVVGVPGKDVTGAHGVRIRADMAISACDPEKMEMVVIPGGNPGPQNLAANADVNKLVRYAAENDRWLAAICAGPLVPGRLGLLAGKHCVCYPGFEHELKGAVIQEGAKVVVDGKVITSRGPGTALGFAYMLLECLASQEKADKLAEVMQYDKR